MDSTINWAFEKVNYVAYQVVYILFIRNYKRHQKFLHFIKSMQSVILSIIIR